MLRLPAMQKLLKFEILVVTLLKIFGHNPEIMAEACSSPLLEKFDIIDINMGCPAPKVTTEYDKHDCEFQSQYFHNQLR